MSDDANERLIEPPVVVESFGELDRKSRTGIRRVAASAHVEALWRAYDLMEEACWTLDEAARDGEDGQ